MKWQTYHIAYWSRRPTKLEFEVNTCITSNQDIDKVAESILRKQGKQPLYYQWRIKIRSMPFNFSAN